MVYYARRKIHGFSIPMMSWAYLYKSSLWTWSVSLAYSTEYRGTHKIVSLMLSFVRAGVLHGEILA